MIQPITIDDEYITLGQLLKLTGAIGTGGQVKFFLSEHEIKVNGVLEDRRGKKIYAGNQVEIETLGTFEIVSKS